MTHIQLLDEATINKIAAGEVIERPASVVKELVENSLDAGASHIRIEIEQGGLKTIRITDNGVGISKEDLSLAPLRHATSKIHQLEDIYETTSMGFRGEALASICHVAKLHIISKTASADAYEITANPDIAPPLQTRHTQGTTILVHDLFAKIPVRKRFLKSPGTEFSYIYEIIQQFALAYPDIDFVLFHNGQELLNTTGVSDLKTLMIMLWDKGIQSHLIAVNRHVERIGVTGFITSGQWTYPNRQHQLITINHRLVKNAMLGKVIQHCYADLIPAKRFPGLVLNITLPPNCVDVNIHPQKTDIKFLQTNAVFESVSAILKSALRMAPKIQASNLENAADSPYFQSSSSGISSESLASLFYPTSPSELPFSDITDHSAASAQNNRPPFLPGQYFQIFDTYIVLKTSEGIWILDQHAVHERILYEQIKADVTQDQNRQMLLIPEIIELEPHQYALAMQAQEIFRTLYFDLEEFGLNQIVIRSIPVQFSGIHLPEFFVQCLAEFQELGVMTDPAQFLKTEYMEKYQQASCKAAIKAGKRLDETEVARLLMDFIDAPANFTCPHGRPLFIKLTQIELEKLFQRR